MGYFQFRLLPLTLYYSHHLLIRKIHINSVIPFVYINSYFLRSWANGMLLCQPHQNILDALLNNC